MWPKSHVGFSTTEVRRSFFFPVTITLQRLRAGLTVRIQGRNERDDIHRTIAICRRCAASQSAFHYRRLLGRDADRVVRFLPLRSARSVLQQALLLAGHGSDARPDREPLRVLDRI